jgi:predicted NAD-dependent protein-ADP-ribosyltransferase YbiA (DUF1768 family)
VHKLFYCFFLLLSLSLSALADYPGSWWEPTSRDGAPHWEVLPQDAKYGQVVLSKRTELGVFSNLSYSPFILDGVRYNSIEGLWQMMKYPLLGASDPRESFDYPYTRNQVRQLSGFKAKKAGDVANDIMRANSISWVSYKGDIFDYKDFSDGSLMHYQIIYLATLQKVIQNKKLRALLLKTRGLELIADHHQGRKPESYFYHRILMKIRDELI